MTHDEFDLARAYGLFGALAGVRAEEGNPIRHLPRGIPDTLSYQAARRYYAVVCADPEGFRRRTGREACVADQAAGWVRSCRSHWGRATSDEERPPYRFVSDPEWHSASWLTLAEIKAALAAAGMADVFAADRPEPRTADFTAVMAAMGSLERTLGKNQVRLVFWFDS